MIRDIDIERELDIWLGPDGDALPDRVVAEAMARIGTTTQRRARRTPHGRTSPMPTLIRLLAAAALVAAVAGSLLLTAGRTGPTPTPEATPLAAIPELSQSPVPSMSTPSPTPAPTPQWTLAPLGDRFESPTLGYSLRVPTGYDTVAATAPWDGAAAHEAASPWLDRFSSPDHMFVILVRSTALDGPTTSRAWLELWGTTPDAPVIEGTCETSDPWTEIPIGDATGYYYHEPCGFLWAVVADGDRGYVFSLWTNVYDSEELTAPIEAGFKKMLASVELSPESAAPPID